MRLPWRSEKEPSTLEREMSELDEIMRVSEKGSDQYDAALKRWLELDARAMEHETLQAQRRINPNTLLNCGKVILIALLTLNFEKMDILTSKVSSLFLRDRDV